MHKPQSLIRPSALLGALLALAPLLAQSQGNNPGAASSRTEQARVIVVFNPEADALRAMPLQARAQPAEVRQQVQRRADLLARSARTPLTAGRAISERMQVVTATGVSSAELARRLSADPSVASAEVDGRKRIRVAPIDPLYTTGPVINTTAQTGGPVSGQWYARAPTADVRAAVNAEAAWARSTGQGVVVAVIDTGVIHSHLDLSNRVLAGYDFIKDVASANDGSARDNDATDPGDFLTDTEVNDRNGAFYGGSPDFCSDLDSGTGRYRAVDSSWHGTKVSGIIAAEANNAQGIAGVAHGARILPVRVLGKCGGFDSDIQAGMRWAAGLNGTDGGANPNPAKILNISLGSDGACSSSYRTTVSEILAAGVTIVAAAGNSAGRAVGTPASCPGVIAVAGLRHAGTKVGFSDLGPEITIAAPGGNCVSTRVGAPCQYPIVTTSNGGTTVPLAGSSTYSDAFDYTVGTSFATPIVSATLALMLSAQPSLKPDELKSLIRGTARAFPTSGADNGPDDSTAVTQCVAPGSVDQLQCYCTTALCGAGMLDANTASSAASQGMLAGIGVSPASAIAGSPITLTSAPTLTMAGRRITRWEWTLVDGGGVASSFDGARNESTASLTASGPGRFTVRLTVYDDQFRNSSTTEATVSVGAAPPSSGGGSMSYGWLFGLALAVCLLWRNKLSSAS